MFDIKLYKELKQLNEDELNQRFRLQRSNDYDNGKYQISFKNHRLKSYICRIFLRFDALLSRRKAIKVGDERIKTDKPHIYVCTHIGRFDIETAMQIIGEDAFFVMGDPGETYNNFQGFFLDNYGRISLDTGYQVSDELLKIRRFDCSNNEVIENILKYINSDYADPELLELIGEYKPGDKIDNVIVDAIYRALDFEVIDVEHLKLLLSYKKDRKIAYETINYALKNGYNVLIFPEAAWNLSPNLLCQDIFDGASKSAFETGADIIPIGMDNQKRVYRGNIGKNIDPKDFSNYKDLTKYVRDMMGLLRLSIIQSYGVYKRSELNETEEDFVNEIMRETENGYTVEVIEKSRYKSEVPSADEVFEPIRKIRRK